MRILLALLAASLALAFVPSVAAQPELPGPVECLLGPHIPETQLYYILWGCTAGQLGVPEPIQETTGCRMGFPAYDIHCNWDDGSVTGPVFECLAECA